MPPAPGELRVVQAFAKTAEGRETLSSPDALADWLKLWELMSATDLDTAQLGRALEVRRALRSWMRANNRGTKDPAAMAVLDSEVSRPLFRLRFDSVGKARFEVVAEGFDGALAQLLLIVGRNRERDWRRLKICPGEGCDRVFYDLSTSICTKWCTARCGNLLRARAFRKRYKRRHGHTPGALASRRK